MQSSSPSQNSNLPPQSYPYNCTQQSDSSQHVRVEIISPGDDVDQHSDLAGLLEDGIGGAGEVSDSGPSR